MGTSNNYPFTTKRDIVKKLQSGDHKAIAEYMSVMQDRHERRLTGEGGASACGWMASQVSTAVKLAKKIHSGEASGADWTNAIRLLSRYVKQIAAHYRALELERDPALAEAARTFGLLGAPGVARRKKPCRVAGATPVTPDPEPEPRPAARKPVVSLAPATVSPQPAPLSERVLGAIREVNGGLRCEEVARALSISTTEAGTVLRELVEERMVRKHGAGRGTRYIAR